jgi:ATP/maltotriose-dependent transcriptional regulator MalT
MLGEHRGILLTLANLAVVAAYGGDASRAATLLDEAGRMAREAVDGPGMGAVELARAETARHAGQPAAARDALERSLELFYDRAGLWHQLGWLRVQQAYLSLDMGDLAAAERQVGEARARFTECDVPVGTEYCTAIEDRLRAANATLT